MRAGIADRIWGQQIEAGRPDSLGVWVGARATVRLGSWQRPQSRFGGFQTNSNMKPSTPRRTQSEISTQKQSL